ncbi:MAG: FAD-dependent oxidoreductase [Candidatus Methylomirabilales bacterium]
MTADRRFQLDRRTFLQALGGAGVLSVGGFSCAEAALLPKPARSETTDVVVIGTGLAGLVAAVQAQEAGARVVILEKMPAAKCGGNSLLAGGLIAVPGAATERARNEYFEDFMKKSQGNGNAALLRLMADQVLGDTEWLRGQGIEFPPPIGVAGYRVKSVVFSPGMYRGMPKALELLRGRVEGKGGKIVYEAKAKQLVMDEAGRVAGVRAATAAGLQDYLARAVVIATGGYAANKQMLETYVDPNADKMMVRGVAWATGDGHWLAQEAGAALVNMGGMAALHIAAVSPKNTSAGNPFTAVAQCIGINREGKRYVDESLGYVANGKATMKQPGQTVALIFDEEAKKQPGVASAVRQFQGLGIEIVEADTLDALAAKIAVPANQLVKTVTEFNAAVQDGKAPGATPPKSGHALKVATPKFYAFYPLSPGVTLTFGGVRINTRAQVQEPDGTVIPGLYAAGECAGDLHYDDYIGGGALAACLVIGRVAGRQAAGEKSRA